MKTTITFSGVYLPYFLARKILSKLTFFLSFCFFFINAQTFTFTGAGDGSSWTDAQNWSPATVPYLTVNNCVANIPNGFTVTIPSESNLRMDGGTINGPGTVVNNGVFALDTNTAKYLSGLVFVNNGTLKSGTGISYPVNFSLFSNSTLNNSSSGHIIIDGIGFTFSNGLSSMINNNGTITKTGTSEKFIAAPFTNKGTVNVHSGILNFSGNKYFETGVYNVLADSELKISSSTGFFKGVWTGENIGVFSINGSNLVAEGNSVTNQISGNGLLFFEGTISGPGSFLNDSLLTVDGNVSKYLSNLNFSNTGTVRLGTGINHSINLILFSDTTMNNQLTGEIIINGIGLNFSNGLNSIVNNYGKVTKLGDNEEIINAPFSNRGSIDVQMNTLNFNGLKYFESGNYNVSAGANLKVSSSTGYFKGVWSGNNVGTFSISGSNMVDTGNTVTNDITGNGLFFSEGTISGQGEFINNTKFDVVENSTKYLSNLTFTNNGVMTLGTGTDLPNNLILYSNSTLNNSIGGQIVINGIGLTYSNGLYSAVNNNGTVKKIGNWQESIVATFVNKGVIDVQQHTLEFSGDKYFETGAYHTSAGAQLKVSGNTGYFKGIWTGSGSGIFSIDGNNYITSDNTMTNQVSGNGLLFSSGTIYGPGALINETLLTADSNSTKYFSNMTMMNKGTFKLGTGTDYSNNFILYSNSVLNNTTTGILTSNGIGMTYSNGSESKLLNGGTLQKLGSFSKTFALPVENSGTIEAREGSLDFSHQLTNLSAGLVKGHEISLPSGTNFSNSGTFDPGVEVGTMLVKNSFKMDGGTLQFNLNGIAEKTGYDYLNYTGSTAPTLNGNVKVNLGFAPSLNDEFNVFRTTSSTIGTTSLPTSITALFADKIYTFNVVSSTNSIKLKLANIALGTIDNKMKDFSIYPNPVGDLLHFTAKDKVFAITIYAMDGRQILTKIPKVDEGFMDVRNLKAGVYVAVVQFENTVQRYRIIKK